MSFDDLINTVNGVLSTCLGTVGLYASPATLKDFERDYMSKGATEDVWKLIENVYQKKGLHDAIRTGVSLLSKTVGVPVDFSTIDKVVSVYNMVTKSKLKVPDSVFDLLVLEKTAKHKNKKTPLNKTSKFVKNVKQINKKKTLKPNHKKHKRWN